MIRTTQREVSRTQPANMGELPVNEAIAAVRKARMLDSVQRVNDARPRQVHVMQSPLLDVLGAHSPLRRSASAAPRVARLRRLLAQSKSGQGTFIATLGLLAAVGAIGLAAVTPPASVAAPLPSKGVLERQKLQEEILKLKQDREQASGVSGFFSRYAAFLTALVAAGGLLATIWKQSSDQSTQRQRDIDQRRVEAERRLEDRFATILNDLGSTAIPTQAGAASSLVTYLRPTHKRFHHQVRVAVLTNLKIDHDEPIRKLLARVYKEAVSIGDPADAFERDLSRAKLENTDLSGLDLREADLAFAELRNSTLVGCDFYRARGIRVNLAGARAGALRGRITSLIEVRFHQAASRAADFSGALMINAHLEGADLRDARFYQARLQAAHLEEARLYGAFFQAANLDDTYFYGAELDERALRTIVRAFNWRNAHFDWETATILENLAAQLPPAQ
jgi:uncharacterized protein YjbI with pentapeptide repeats